MKQVRTEVVILNYKRPLNIVRVVDAFRNQSVPVFITLIDAAADDSFKVPDSCLKKVDNVITSKINFGSVTRFLICNLSKYEFMYFYDDDMLPGSRAVEYMESCADELVNFSVLGCFGRILDKNYVYGNSIIQGNTKHVAVDFVIRNYFIRSVNLSKVSEFMHKVLAGSSLPESRDDLIVNAGIQSITGYKSFVCKTPCNKDMHPVCEELDAPHAVSAKPGHLQNRQKLINEFTANNIWKPIRKFNDSCFSDKYVFFYFNNNTSQRDLYLDSSGLITDGRAELEYFWECDDDTNSNHPVLRLLSKTGSITAELLETKTPGAWAGYWLHNADVRLVCVTLQKREEIFAAASALDLHKNLNKKFIEDRLIPTLNGASGTFYFGFFSIQNNNEFSGYLDFLNANISKLDTYLEIGTCFGGTLLSTYFLMKAKNKGPIKCVSIDLKDLHNLKSLGYLYPEIEFVTGDSASATIKSFIKSYPVKFDLAFIDGNHSYSYAKSDFLTVLDNATNIAFHDIADGDVKNLWNDLKKSDYKDKFDFHEWKLANHKLMGIGLMVRKNK